MLMTYDQHYAYSGPGPVAGLIGWNGAQYATQVIPAEKLCWVSHVWLLLAGVRW